MAVSQEFVRRSNAVLQEWTKTEKAEGVGTFSANHLNEYTHAFLEALTKKTAVVLVYN